MPDLQSTVILVILLLGVVGFWYYVYWSISNLD